MISTGSYVSLSGSVLPRSKDLRRLAPRSSEERQQVILLLRPAPTDDRVFAVARDRNAAAPLQRDYASPGAFHPGPEATRCIEEFARGYELRLTWPGGTGGLIALLEGMVSAMNSAFRVELHDYFTRVGEFRGYEGAVSLPVPVARYVRGVFGLSNHTGIFEENPEDVTRPPPVAEEGPAPRPAQAVASLTELYGFPEESSGLGQSIAVVAQTGQVAGRDLSAYLEAVGVAAPDLRMDVRAPAGLTGHQGDPDALRALQVMATLAPRADYRLYGLDRAPTDDWFAGFLFTVARALFDESRNDIVLILPGLPEYFWGRDVSRALSLLLAIGAAMGVSVVAPSGDFGAAGFEPGRSERGANVRFPASSPYCLACGGTMPWFERAGDLAYETVWNDMRRVEKPRATGGGYSALFGAPDYQRRARVGEAELRGGRGVPDVAAVAAPDGGLRLYRNGRWREREGGTVLAAAVWSALTARLNEALGARVGWLHPWLYRIRMEAGRPLTRPVRHRPGTDVWPEPHVNCNGPLSRRFSAAFCVEPDSIWNACCGLGSPDGVALLQALRES